MIHGVILKGFLILEAPPRVWLRYVLLKDWFLFFYFFDFSLTLGGTKMERKGLMEFTYHLPFFATEYEEYVSVPAPEELRPYLEEALRKGEMEAEEVRFSFRPDFRDFSFRQVLLPARKGEERPDFTWLVPVMPH